MWTILPHEVHQWRFLSKRLPLYYSSSRNEDVYDRQNIAPAPPYNPSHRVLYQNFPQGKLSSTLSRMFGRPTHNRPYPGFPNNSMRSFQTIASTRIAMLHSAAWMGSTAMTHHYRVNTNGARTWPYKIRLSSLMFTGTNSRFGIPFPVLFNASQRSHAPHCCPVPSH